MYESSDPRFRDLLAGALSGRLTRRQVFRRGLALGVSAGAMSFLLEACGSSSSSSSSSSSAASTSSSGSSGTATSAASSGSPAATSASSGGTPKQGGSIIIGTLGEASSINPLVANESEGLFRCKQLFDLLVRISPKDLKPAPGIAKSWDVNGLTYTFHLQENAKFSDGSSLTADDVAFTIESILAKKTASPNQSRLLTIKGAQDFANGTTQSVEGLKIVDPNTLQITLAQPDASFLFNLRYVMPVPKKLLQGQDLSLASKNSFFQKPIGAGPFKFVSWNVGGDFVAERNPNFYGAPEPYLDKFTHRVIADSDSLVNSLLSGGIDGSIYANPAGIDQLKSNSDLVVLVPPFGSPDGWQFNFKNPYLAKKEVRQAVAYAMDMSQFAKDSLYGLGKPGTGPIAPGSYAYDKSLQPWPYDLDKAKSLLQQAGTPPSGIKFVSNQGNVLRQDFLTYTQSQLAKIGWKIDPELQEYATLTNNIINKNYDVAESQEVGSGADLDPGELYNIYSTGGSENFTGYTNPALDKLLQQAQQELDIAKQIPLYAQIQQTIVQDVPATFSWYRPYIHVVKKKFGGYVDTNALPEGLFTEMEKWYIKS
ncbi:MAG TPA: ABC transporter substrate-binding protein [Thermomicrobiaceae bacterium]|nr:ABC transporter substrate-binding protein [Thermomicrobiaceae bacterium]